MIRSINNFSAVRHFFFYAPSVSICFMREFRPNNKSYGKFEFEKSHTLAILLTSGRDTHTHTHIGPIFTSAG